MGRTRTVTCWMAMLLLVLCSDIILCRRGSTSKKANQNKSPPPVNKPSPPSKKEPVKIPGTLCYTGQLLDIKLEPEDARYYTDNFKKFPDCVYYPRCFQSLEANATKDALVSDCFNVTKQRGHTNHNKKRAMEQDSSLQISDGYKHLGRKGTITVLYGDIGRRKWIKFRLSIKKQLPDSEKCKAEDFGFPRDVGLSISYLKT
ncbi:Prion-like protein doppel [Chelonia mydas]|uniref:Prion-like protein doppel n=1 Tax=Chelonia mydas TaxID=8469 RepID=M7BZ98_CHEMY|nr:Prion-like protein doppel [Chelonia mydas]